MFQKFIQDRFTDVDNNLNFFDVCIKKVFFILTQFCRKLVYYNFHS